MPDKPRPNPRTKVRRFKLPSKTVRHLPGLIGSMKPRKLLKLIDKIEAIPDTPERRAFYEDLDRIIDENR